jgi:hypothetical protein
MGETSSRSRTRQFAWFLLLNKSASLKLAESFKNFSKSNEDQLKCEACKLSIQHMTDTDIINAAMKQERDEEGGEDEGEEGESSEFVSHNVALTGVDILLEYMGQRMLEYSSLENLYFCEKQLQKQMSIQYYFLEYM